VVTSCSQGISALPAGRCTWQGDTRPLR